MRAIYRLAAPLAAALLILSPATPVQAQGAEDFGFNSVPAAGRRPVLLIMVEFPDTEFTATHTQAYFENMIFGPQHPSVAGYFAEVSRQRLTLYKAGVVSLRYDETLAEVQQANDDTRLRRRILEQASTVGGFDYAPYAPARGPITPEQLVIVIVTSHPVVTGPGDPNDGGQTASPDAPISLRVRRSTRHREVELAAVPSGFGQSSSFMTAAHEISHQILDHFDIYAAGSAQLSLVGMTIFSRPDDFRTFHLDPWHKMRAGWIEPRIQRLDRSGGPVLMTAPTGEPTPSDGARPLVLYDPRRGTSEFFVLEYRARRRLPSDPLNPYEVNAGAAFAGYDADVSLIENGSNAAAGERGVVIWYVKLADRTRPVLVQPAGGLGYFLMYALGAPGQIRGGQQLWRAAEVPVRLQWPAEPGPGTGTGGADTGVALWIGNTDATTPPSGAYSPPNGTTLEWVAGDAFILSQPILRKLNPSTVTPGALLVLEGRFPPAPGGFQPQLTREGATATATVQSWTPTQVTLRLAANAAPGSYSVRLADVGARRQSAALPLEIAAAAPLASIVNPRVLLPQGGTPPAGGAAMRSDWPAYRVRTATPFYRNGPMQGAPPDGNLAAQTLVRLSNEKSGGYARVQLPDGSLVWVEARALAPER